MSEFSVFTVCIQQNIPWILSKKESHSWHEIHKFHTFPQKQSHLQPVFELKLSEYLYWFHKWKETKVSPMQSNWKLIFPDSQLLQAFHFRKGKEEVCYTVWTIRLAKMLPFTSCPSFEYWKRKRKMSYKTFFFFHFHFFASVCKAVGFIAH